MPASYPSSPKSFTALNPGDAIQDTHVESAYDEITAVEQALLAGVAHALIPDATANGRDLGSGSRKFRDLYLSGDMESDSVTAAGAATVGGALGVTGVITGAAAGGLVLSHASAGVKERARSVAMGAWTAPAFSAGDFTGSGAMTWTVGAGDVVTFAYMLVGKTMTVAYYLENTTVGGTPDLWLQIAIPAGFIAARRMDGWSRVVDNAALRDGVVRVEAAGSVILIGRADAVALAAATDATTVSGQIAFEVQ